LGFGLSCRHPAERASVVYIFFIRNKSETYIGREQGAPFR
jgi:hypothetical protein